jgi:hypothetical protein
VSSWIAACKGRFLLKASRSEREVSRICKPKEHHDHKQRDATDRWPSLRLAAGNTCWEARHVRPRPQCYLDVDGSSKLDSTDLRGLVSLACIAANSCDEINDRFVVFP